jgi:hypothetical protein
METFTVVIRNAYATDKTRSLKIKAEDHILAHKLGTQEHSQLREDIISIKDSRKNEVYNIEKGFLFE